MAGESVATNIGDGEPEEVLLSYLDSPKFLKASANAMRLVSRLKSDIHNRQVYQIHQDLRNIYFRFANHKEKIEALNDLLYNGAIYLLNLNEFITGLDIALLLLEISSKYLQNRLDDVDKSQASAELANPSMKYHIQKKTVPLTICQQVTSLAVRLPNNELGQPKFIAEALRVLAPKILNRDLLHHALASSLWRHRDFVNARYHFLHCATLENAEDIALLLIEYHSLNANKSEVDLFITQFIFQLLCIQCPIDSPKPPGCKQDAVSPPNLAVSRKSRRTIRSVAEKIFSTYTLKHPLLSQLDIPFSSLPLLNFTYFIISILDSNQPESSTFRILHDIYRTAWNRDPNYQSYLNRIGIIYFGIVDRQKQQQQGGLINNILMSLFEGADDDDEGEESDPTNNMSLCDDLD